VFRKWRKISAIPCLRRLVATPQGGGPGSVPGESMGGLCWKTAKFYSPILLNTNKYLEKPNTNKNGGTIHELKHTVSWSFLGTINVRLADVNYSGFTVTPVECVYVVASL